MNTVHRLLASRLIIAVAGLLSGLLFCVTIVVGYYNLLYSLQRIGGLFGGEDTPLPIPEWVVPLLQDLSVVSPALVAFSLLCMTQGCWLLVRARSTGSSIGGLQFPFPSGYRGYYVQLGLIGTIIGFVMAFSRIEPALEGQAELLLAALGTALWSTLTAITLAYAFCPLVELLFGYWERIRTGVKPGPDAVSAIEELRQRTVNASDSLARFAESVASLNSEMEQLALQQRLHKLESGLSEIHIELQSLRGRSEALQQGGQGMNRRLGDVEEWQRETDRRMERLLARFEVQQDKASVLENRVDSLESSVQRLLAQLKRALDA